MNNFERCYNCIHRAPCGAKGGLTQDGAICNHFKDKSLFVELPCKVGDTVYKTIITSKGKPAIWTIIITSISVEIDKKGCPLPNSYAIGHLKNTPCGESIDFSDFGKTVFLTKEDAQKKDQEAPNE